MIPDKETRDIQAYFRDTLPKIRREKFEERLQNDQAFKARVEELRPILAALEDIQTAEKIKDLIAGAELAETEDFPRKVRPLWGKLRYLAAACVILLAGIFAYDSTMDLRIYDEAYQSISGKSGGSTKDECPDEALVNKYLEGTKDQNAYKMVIEALSKKPQVPCVQFYEGMSYLGLEEVQKAIPLLLSGTKSTDTAIRQSAEWYLSVAYVRTHDKELAKAQLRKITDNDQQHQYKVFARELLLKLDKKPLLFNFQF